MPNATADEVIDLLLSTFGRRLTPEIRDGIAAQGFTIDEAVTLASIVEREAVLDEERPLIAGVYVNRVQNPDAGGTAGLLNADPTLQYGLGTVANGDAPISRWGSIQWWPPLEVGGGDVVLPDELAGIPDLPVPGLAAHAHRFAAHRIHRGRRCPRG